MLGNYPSPPEGETQRAREVGFQQKREMVHFWIFGPQKARWEIAIFSTRFSEFSYGLFEIDTFFW